MIPAEEWDDQSSVEIGDEVQVWLDAVESDSGHIMVSKRKADRVLNWQRIVSSKKEGDNVQGRVMRKIKGGLLVDASNTALVGQTFAVTDNLKLAWQGEVRADFSGQIQT